MGKRSLTKSEWTAFHTLNVLRKMLLVPHVPHDCIEIGDIERVDVKQDFKTGRYSDARERIIVYSWGKDWRSVSITLKKYTSCNNNENPALLSDNEEYPWSVTRIEIKGKGTCGTGEGIILFADKASVSLISEHLRLPVPQNSFY